MKNNILSKSIKLKCTSCGNCSAVCPKNAITFELEKRTGIVRPCLDRDKCINCGICVKNCPVNKALLPTKGFLGNILSSFVGYSTDETIRFKSTSGGILTSALIYLLQNSLVDKVLVVSFNENSPLSVSANFTDDVSKVVNACGSKYQVVNINSELKTVLNENKKFAFVGLPCHLRALEIFLENNPVSAKKILYKFSLCCSHNVSNNVFDYVLHKLKLHKTDINSFIYRGDGWPEYLKFKLSNEKSIKFSKDLWNNLFLSFFYTPKHCFNCYDLCGETSDISFADAWLDEYCQKESSGFSLIFPHTKSGQDLIEKMSEQKIIEIKSHSVSDVLKAQKIGLMYKKKLYQSENIISKLYVFILKLNSTLSEMLIFRYTHERIIKYYYYFLYITFAKKFLKDFEKDINNEYTDCKPTYL